MGQRLLEALIEDHVEMYQNNPIFREAVISLSRMLPVWVDGLAEKSGPLNERFQIMQKNLIEGLNKDVK